MAKKISNSLEAKLRLLIRVRKGWSGRAATAADCAVCLGMVDSGWLDGWVTLAANGRPVKVEDLRLTPLGEEFLDKNAKAEVKRPRALKRETSVLLKGLCCYILLLIFLILLRLNGDAATARQQTSSPPPVIEKKHSGPSLHDWPVGVCGIPPVE